MQFYDPKDQGQVLTWILEHNSSVVCVAQIIPSANIILSNAFEK